MSAAFKFNNKLIKTVLNSKKTKFADLEEVWKVTVNNYHNIYIYIFYIKNCFNGAVPPFGSLFNLKTYVDKSLIDQGDNISFNAGLRTKSLVIKTKDFITLEDPIICEFCDKNEETKLQNKDLKFFKENIIKINNMSQVFL